MAEELRLNIVSTADSKGFEKAAKDISEAKAEAKGLSDEWAKAGDNAETLEQSTDGATKSIREHGEQVRVMRAEYEKTIKKIEELDSQLIAGGDRGALKKSIREQRAWLSELKKAARDLKVDLSGGTGPVTGVMDGVLGGIPRLGGVPPALVAGGVAIGVAIAPPLAAAVSGAILGAVGVGGVVGGAVLAAKDPRVQAAWKTLGSGLMRELEPVGDAFAIPVARAAEIFRNSFDDSGFVEDFAAAAALVEPLARGLGGLFEKMGPGLGDALMGARPVFEMLREELPELGEDFGEALSTIAAVGPSAARGLGQLLDVTGELTKQAAAAGAGLTAINNLFPATSALLKYIPIGGFAQVVGTALEQLAPKTAAVAVKMTHAANATRGMGFALTATTDAINVLNPGLDQLRNKLDLKQVQEQNNEALFRLREEVKAHGTDLRATTEAGIMHRQMLLGMVEGYAAERDANIQAGMAAEQANAKFRQQVVDLEALLIKLGFNKNAVWDLIGAMRNIPSRVNTAIVLEYQTRGKPAGEHSGLRIHELDGGRAAGGPVMAGKSYLVGERGPEILQMGTTAGHIMSNAASFGGGMWAAPIQYTPSGNRSWDAWFEDFRDQVQSRGGTLAVVGVRRS
jgi:hypothetical protein